MERNIIDFIETHVESVADLEAQARGAEWRYLRHGRPADEKTLDERRTTLDELHANRENFARVRTYDDESLSSGEETQRQIRRMRLCFAESQIPPETERRADELVEEIGHVAHTYRVAIDDEELTLFEVDKIFRESDDSELREAVWKTTLGMGEDFGDHMVRLIGIRNRVARDLGHGDFYRMNLELMELDESEMLRLVKKVVRETEKAYDGLKSEIDAEANRRFKLRRKGVMPWHYADLFFRCAPNDDEVDFDRYFEGVDHIEAARKLFESMGFDVGPILNKSDLTYRPNKEAEIQCIHMDRRGQDVRLVGMVGEDEEAMKDLLEALGRAVYHRGLAPGLPFLLREPGHELLLEGVGRIFSNLTRHPDFLSKMVGANKSSVTKALKTLGDQPKRDALIKCRWLPAFIYFERAVYENPGRDLQRIWWDLVEIFQKIRPPEDHAHGHDWACNLEIAEAPVTRQNDFLADLIAAQLEAAMAAEIGPQVLGNVEVAPFLNERLFVHGAGKTWQELIAGATGRKLEAKDYLARVLG